MQQEAPTVTVLMPVYNAEKYVGEAIESILNQTYRDFEFLIINDGSTDNSATVIQSYKDERIRYVENGANLRLIATLNKGIELAGGKYIARMDADDISESNRLQTQVTFMTAHPEIGVCGSWFHSIGSGSNSLSKYPTDDFNIRYAALYQCPFCHPTIMFRTPVMMQHGIKYSSEYPHAEDYELWLRMSRVTQMANIPESLLKYRQHDSSISKIESETQNRLNLRIRKHFFSEAGINVSDQDADLFRRLNYFDNSFSMQQLQQLSALMLSLLIASKATGYLNESELRALLSDKWYHLCTNHSYHGSSVWRLYHSKPELKGQKTPIVDMVKLRLKTWFKK
jgi:glycosyltransferase involved in cell wall biosynthesis